MPQTHLEVTERPAVSGYSPYCQAWAMLMIARFAETDVVRS